jgi:chromosome partitioning protein
LLSFSQPLQEAAAVSLYWKTRSRFIGPVRPTSNSAVQREWEARVPATTISLLNMKGGVGKTTLAVNLAWYLHQYEKQNVLLVDLDPQFNATQYVMDYAAFEEHRTKAGTIADLLIDQPKLDLRLKRVKKNPKAALHNIRRTLDKRFDLLPAELALAWAVKSPAQMDYKLEKLLTRLRDDYNYIFVDCAPTDSVLTTMALSASDYLLIPMRPDRFSILGFANLNETIKTFRNNCIDAHSVKVLGIVFTQVTGTSSVEQQVMADIRAAAQKAGTYVFGSSLRYSNSFIRSVKDQTPIFETLYVQDKARLAAVKIAQELTKRITELATDAKAPKGKRRS